jgi:hypothetical protein
MKSTQLRRSLVGIAALAMLVVPACGSGADPATQACGAVVVSCPADYSYPEKVPRQCTDGRGFTAEEVQFRIQQCGMASGMPAAKTTPCNSAGAVGACIFKGVPAGGDGTDGNQACTVTWYWRDKAKDIAAQKKGCESIGATWCEGSACDSWRS